MPACAAADLLVCAFWSAVSWTVMDARWKHTWSLSYVLLVEVPLAPCLTPPQGSHPKNKKVHMRLCAHASTDKGVRYHSSSWALDVSACVDTKENNTYADTHKASSGWMLPQ